MAPPSNLILYSTALNPEHTSDQIAWTNLNKALGHNTDDTKNFAYITSNVKYVYSDIVRVQIDATELSNWLSTNTSQASIRLVMRCSLEVKPGQNGEKVSAQVTGKITKANDSTIVKLPDDVDQSIFSTVLVADGKVDFQSRFYSINIMFEDILYNLVDLKTFLQFTVTNPDNVDFTIKIFEIRYEITTSTNTDYLVILCNDGRSPTQYLENGDTAYLPQIYNNSISDIVTYTVYNLGEVVLTLPVGCSSHTSAISPFDSIWPGSSTEIFHNEKTEYNFTYKSAETGSYNQEIIFSGVGSSGHYYTFSTKVKYDAVASGSGGINNTPVMSCLIGSTIIQDKNTISLSSFPVGIEKIIGISVSSLTVASPYDNLIISNFTINGNGSLSTSGSISPPETINQGATKYIYILLETSTNGSKKVDVVINSNGTIPIFSFSLTYSIAEQSKIELKNSDGTAIVSDEVDDLGTVDNGRPLTRSFALQNSGIYRDLVISTISVSNKNLTLKNVPSLPVNLHPKKVNTLRFDVDFNTNDVGIKNSGVSITYTDGDPYP